MYRSGLLTSSFGSANVTETDVLALSGAAGDVWYTGIDPAMAQDEDEDALTDFLCQS